MPAAPVIEDITGLDIEDVDEGVADDIDFVPAKAFGGARPGFAYRSGDFGVGYYREGSAAAIDAAPPANPATAPTTKAPLTDMSRDGVPLTEALIRRKAEHNECMLSNLEEIALHQLDIDKIETLNNCRCLKIVYLQSNLIRKIENLGRLKELDYLNLALSTARAASNRRIRRRRPAAAARPRARCTPSLRPAAGRSARPPAQTTSRRSRTSSAARLCASSTSPSTLSCAASPNSLQLTFTLSVSFRSPSRAAAQERAAPTLTLTRTRT